MATEKIFHLLNEPRQIFMERGGRGLAEARQGDKDSRPPPPLLFSQQNQTGGKKGECTISLGVFILIF
jgi:hypothetical protein